MAKTNDRLADALQSLQKKYGQGSISKLGDQTPVTDNLLSTGSLLLDQALGGGIARGRITEVFGNEGAGKTTLCLQLVAQCQKEGGVCAYVDVENALNLQHAADLGVKTEDLYFTQPDSAEQAMDFVDTLAKGGVDLIILDSVAALAPQAEIDGEMSDVTVGLVARLMGKLMRKISATTNENNTAVVFINQLRDKIATGWSAGPSETTPGGRALKFAASQRLELKKATAIKSGDTVIGNNVRIKVVKNKIAAPMKVVELPLIFGKGFSAEDEVIDLAVEYNIIEKGGAWFTTHNGERLCGKDKVKIYYNANPTLAAELREKVIAKLRGALVPEYEVDEKTGTIVD